MTLTDESVEPYFPALDQDLDKAARDVGFMQLTQHGTTARFDLGLQPACNVKTAVAAAWELPDTPRDQGCTPGERLTSRDGGVSKRGVERPCVLLGSSQSVRRRPSSVRQGASS
jgi:hypothetical protein